MCASFALLALVELDERTDVVFRAMGVLGLQPAPADAFRKGVVLLDIAGEALGLKRADGGDFVRDNDSGDARSPGRPPRRSGRSSPSPS